MMSMIRGLEVWRDLDHADAIKLSRHEVIELLEETELLRRHIAELKADLNRSKQT